MHASGARPMAPFHAADPAASLPLPSCCLPAASLPPSCCRCLPACTIDYQTDVDEALRLMKMSKASLEEGPGHEAQVGGGLEK